MTHDDEEPIDVRAEEPPNRVRFGVRLVADLNGALRPSTEDELVAGHVRTKSSTR